MTSGTMTVDGGELAYEVRGSGSPVVLLHGGFLSGAVWDAQVARFDQAHTVVRYDTRGHGRSSTPSGPFAHHEDLRELLDGLGIARASVVGLSLGARTAIDFGIAHPDRVDRLVLASPGISGMVFRDPFVLEHMGRIGAAGSVEGAVECVLRTWVDGPHRAPEEVEPAVRESCRAVVLDNFARHRRAMTPSVQFGAIERVAELVAPTLVVVGDLDSSDIHGVADLLEASAADARKVVVGGAGHMVNLERPEEFDREVLAFLG